MKSIGAEIKKIWKETHDVRTLHLEPDEDIDFIPGQYCLVSIPGSEKHKDMRKPFTYASSPTEDYVELTVKKIGDFTTALHGLDVGDRLVLEGPRGESLNFDKNTERDVIFLAGGSGITPFISAIRYAVDIGFSKRITLVFSNRTEKDIIYRKELEELDKRNNFVVINTLTDDWSEDWEGETGMIDEEILNNHIDGFKEKLWYICGPPPMIDVMENILLKRNVPEKRIRYEKWMIPGKGD